MYSWDFWKHFRKYSQRFLKKFSVLSFSSSKDNAGTSIGGGAFCVSGLTGADTFEPFWLPKINKKWQMRNLYQERSHPSDMLNYEDSKNMNSIVSIYKYINKKKYGRSNEG